MAKKENKKRTIDSNKTENKQNNKPNRSPQEILEEFKDLSVDIDKKLTGETIEVNEQVLENELERAIAAEQELKNIIETAEKNEHTRETFSKFWNGSSDGWFN